MEIIKFVPNHPELAEHGKDTNPAGVEVILSHAEFEFLKYAARAHYEAISKAQIANVTPIEFAEKARTTFLRIDGAMRQIGNYAWPEEAR